jgi:hypothetical protein
MRRHPPREGYDLQVENFMRRLDADYVTLRNHTCVQSHKNGEKPAPRHEEEFLKLLNQSAPVTELGQIVASVFKWMANKSRPIFTKLMFEGHYACSSLLVDNAMAERGLKVEKYFSIKTGVNGKFLGPARPPRVRKGGRGRRYNSSQESDSESGTPRKQKTPVLDTSQVHSLLQELGQKAQNSTSYRDALVAGVKPAEKSTGVKPAEKSAEKPAGVKPAEKTTEKPAEKSDESKKPVVDWEPEALVATSWALDDSD